ncbi:MAG: carboxypeptidase regulatory-like domain-containing protein [Planctomycetaceae bacterium]|nr:carboxypeptidase regulatory-like domain-containing protein [Planctomycetaceae bacterium]
MKRALTILPFLALALGLGLFLLRRSDPRPASEAHNPAKTPEAPPAAPPAPGAPSAPPREFTSPEASNGTIRFTVTYLGRPAAGADISVLKAGSGERMDFKTEPDGTQILRSLPVSEYAVRIDFEDALPFSTHAFIEPGKTELVTADLRQGSRITGIVTDKAGRPVAGTLAVLFDAQNKNAIAVQDGNSDGTGRYVIRRVPVGSYAIRFRNENFKPVDRPGIVLTHPGDEARMDVVLEVGARLSGRVLDEAGGPIPGADVLAVNDASGNTTKSAEDGSFTVGGLTEAPANISATKAGYGKVVLRNLSGNPTDVVLRLPKAGTLLGRLAIDKVPRQTHVILSKYDEELRQEIPMESRFFALPTTATFAVDNLGPGAYWIDVQVEGYEPTDRPQVVVASGQITRETVITMRKKN